MIIIIKFLFANAQKIHSFASIGHSGLVPNGYSCLNCCVICVIFSSISVRLILLTHIALLLHEATGRCLVLLCLHCAVWSPHSCPGPDAKKDCGLDVIWNASIKKIISWVSSGLTSWYWQLKTDFPLFLLKLHHNNSLHFTFYGTILVSQFIFINTVSVVNIPMSGEKSTAPTWWTDFVSDFSFLFTLINSNLDQ